MGEWWSNTSRWLLGQLLWSKARLFTVIGVVTAVGLWLMIPPDVPFLITSDQAPAGDRQQAAVGGAAPEPAAVPSPTVGGFGTPGEDTTGQQAAVVEFLVVYLSPPTAGGAETRQDWVDDLEPVTGSVLLAGLEVTRFEDLPSGTPGNIDWVTVGDTYSEANVALSDGSLLRLVVTADPAGVWRVTDVRPAPTEGV